MVICTYMPYKRWNCWQAAHDHLAGVTLSWHHRSCFVTPEQTWPQSSGSWWCMALTRRRRRICLLALILFKCQLSSQQTGNVIMHFWQLRSLAIWLLHQTHSSSISISGRGSEREWCVCDSHLSSPLFYICLAFPSPSFLLPPCGLAQPLLPSTPMEDRDGGGERTLWRTPPPLPKYSFIKHLSSEIYMRRHTESRMPAMFLALYKYPFIPSPQ